MKILIIAIITIYYLLLVFIVSGIGAEFNGTLVLEAEDMTVKACANNGAVPDGWRCLGPGKLAETVTFKEGKVDLAIIAKGDYAGGAWPDIKILIGSAVVATIPVDSATWKTFTVEAVETTAGAQELSVDFINDWYQPDQNPPDRNFYLDKITITKLATKPNTGQVTLAWDPNTEEDLVGYKIYYGLESRKGQTNLIPEWCAKWEPENEECENEWKVICTWKDQFDPACYKSLFNYNTIIDVKNVNQYTLKDIKLDKTYYFAARQAHREVSECRSEII